jgi:hypothetical protein
MDVAVGLLLIGIGIGWLICGIAIVAGKGPR